VPSDTEVKVDDPSRINAVIVAQESQVKRGIRIVPDTTLNLQQIHGNPGLDSGKP
jgi:hypothetical protein